MLNRIVRIIRLITGTTTGANLRKIWLETGVSPYQSTRELNKIDGIKELAGVKYGIAQN